MATADQYTVHPLPRGRHAAARTLVVASQRGRLIEAMAGCVADTGYAATTVAAVIARAGVSRKTFYEHFRDKQDCFLAAWEAGTDLLIEQVSEAASQPGTWRQRLRAGTAAYLQVLADEPEFARTFLIEVLGAGDAALDRRAQIHGRFAELLKQIHRVAMHEDPALSPLPDYAFKAATAAVWELVADHIRTRGVQGLTGLVDQIVQVHCAFFTGDFR